jgi:hypothetical protein
MTLGHEAMPSEYRAERASQEIGSSEDRIAAPAGRAVAESLIHPRVRGWQGDAGYFIAWRELWLEPGN